MAQITRFQLNELKREAWFQIKRLEAELAMAPHRVGMRKSKQRLCFLLAKLKELEQDGMLQLVDNPADAENLAMEVMRHDGAENPDHS
jgi:replication initiation and membrane attachment protein DnaB